MGISGTDVALMVAASGLARAGATRSGLRAVGARLRFYAMSGVARSGATRSGYHGPALAVSVGGVERGWGRSDATYEIDSPGVRIQDVQGETPSTASFVARGWTPTVGMVVIMRLGSINNSTRLFAGTILRVLQVYEGTPENQSFLCSCIDYTWGMNTTKVSGHFTGSATTIAQSLISTYAPEYSSAHVQAGLPTVDGGITFTMQDLTDCLSQLAKRVGAGCWYCDYDKVVHFGLTDPAPIVDPTILDLTRSAADRTFWDVFVERDLSQVVTRVHVEGGGSTALAQVSAGETIIPIAEPDWYSATGGVVKSGPQRITYTGLNVGGGGGLVGPGAAPSGALVATATSGAGPEDGAHDYATTFVTAAGESLPSPLTAITVGPVDAPTTAPTAAAPTIGTGPDPGAHDYAVSFVTSSGETTVGPSVTRATTVTADPTTSPSAVASVGAGVDTGPHDYAVSFVTAIGETLAGPVGTQASCGPVSSGYINEPTTAPTAGAPSAGAGPDDGDHYYAVTFENAAGETTPSAQSGTVTASSVAADPVSAPSSAPSNTNTPGPYTAGWAVGDVIAYRVTFVNAYGETTASDASDGVAGTAYDETYMNANTVSLPVSGHASVTARRLYRYKNGSIVGYRQISDNTTTSWVDYNVIPVPGVSPPGSNTATVPATYTQVVGLSAIPVGPSGTTSRKVYRTAAGGAQLKLLATIANNTATTYSDTSADASLGADAPTENTTATAIDYNRVSVTGIPLGDANCTARKLYRRSAGAGLKLVDTGASLSDNTTTTYTDVAANAALGAAPLGTSTAYLQRIALSAIPTGGALVTQRKVYRSLAGTTTPLKLLATLADNTTTTYADTSTDAAITGAASAPGSNTATANQVVITAVPLGTATVTARKVYRTTAGGSQLKLQQTIADNTTTTGVTDATADASLGANVPTVDASGLTQAEGQVIAGATTLIVAGTGAFPSAGWAVIGNGQQVIRYTGVTGSSLTGIPASGDGAITASIGYNSTVTAAPQLTGVPASGTGAIQYLILKGDDVNLFVTRNDTAAQAALAALIGGDGVQEDFIQDRRLAQTECEARGDAQLALRGTVDVSLSYASRDLHSRAGRLIAANLSAPTSVAGSYRIQSVAITNFVSAILPTFAVTAGSDLFTFEDLLRRARR